MRGCSHVIHCSRFFSFSFSPPPPSPDRSLVMCVAGPKKNGRARGRHARSFFLVPTTSNLLRRLAKATRSLLLFPRPPLLRFFLGGGTLGTRGFSRVRREFSVLAEGRHIFGRRSNPPAAKPREKRAGQKPETALEKSLAPRVRGRLYEG